MKRFNLDKKNVFLLNFLLKGILFYILWILIYENWLANSAYVDDVLIDHLVSANKFLLHLFGYTIFHYDATIGIDGSHGVYIGAPCDGVSLFALFTGFVVVFSGKIKHKIPFIILGILIIHVLNILRIFSLTVMAKYKPEMLDFNHKYTFTIIIYLVIFSMWVFWVKKYASKT